MHQGSRIFKERWKCFNCQYPRCTRCKKRPEFAGPSHTSYTKDGKYICPTCRYPLCTGCDKERPKTSKYSVEVQETWRCASCQLTGKNISCKACGETNPSSFDRDNRKRFYDRCRTCQLAGKHNISCKACGETNPSAFDRDPCRNLYDRCRNCQYPQCSTCEQRSTEIWTPHPKIKNQMYRCTACQKTDATTNTQKKK